MIYFSRHTSGPFLPKSFSGANSGKMVSFYSTINKKTKPSEEGVLKGRDCFRVTSETFPGVREYLPFINGSMLEIASFQDEVRVFNPNDSYKLIGGFGRTKDPEDKNHVVCQDGYLAVHSRQDSIVHVYTADKKKHIACYEVAGRIVQLDILDKCLYVSAQEFSTAFNFHQFDLQDTDRKEPILTQIIASSEKKYSLHMRNVVQSQVYAQNSRGAILQESVPTNRGMNFPNGDHFIRVLEAFGVYDIEKIGKAGKRESIASGIRFPDSLQAYCHYVYYSSDRLIVAQKSIQRIQVHAYDLKSKNQLELFSALNSNSTYQSDLLTTTDKIYYLTLNVEKSGPVFNLKTVEFGRE